MTGYVTKKSKMGGERWTGENNPSPEQANKAQTCRCDEPWLERDEDGQLHCVQCGKDYAP